MTDPSYKSFLGEPVCDHPGCPCNSTETPAVKHEYADGDKVNWEGLTGTVRFITATLAENRVVKFRPDFGPYDFIVSMDELEAA